MMKEIDNNSEFYQIDKEFEEDVLYENVLERIENQNKIHLNFDEEITFTSNNFHDFHIKYPQVYDSFNIDIIKLISSNDQLRHNNEEELFDVILELYMKLKEYTMLFSYLSFINLSTKQSLKIEENFDLNDLNKTIRERICKKNKKNQRCTLLYIFYIKPINIIIS